MQLKNWRNSFKDDYWKKPNGDLRLDIDLEQALKICANEKGISVWNSWRTKYPDHKIFLEGADLRNLPLQCIDLRDACLTNAHLEGADLYRARLEGAWIQTAFVDSSTVLWKSYIDKQGKLTTATNMRGVPLDGIRIDPGTKILLEYNSRRLNWEEWYLTGNWALRILKKIAVKPFWLTSDYGISSLKIIYLFCIMTTLFALAYFLFPELITIQSINNHASINAALEHSRPSGFTSFWHSLYFSVVTMTTLGFGDIHANHNSVLGQILVMLHVIIGYFILGSLITRLNILFSTGGPAAKFSDKNAIVPHEGGCNVWQETHYHFF